MPISGSGQTRSFLVALYPGNSKLKHKLTSHNELKVLSPKMQSSVLQSSVMSGSSSKAQDTRRNPPDSILLQLMLWVLFATIRTKTFRCKGSIFQFLQVFFNLILSLYKYFIKRMRNGKKLLVSQVKRKQRWSGALHHFWHKTRRSLSRKKNSKILKKLI